MQQSNPSGTVTIARLLATTTTVVTAALAVAIFVSWDGSAVAQTEQAVEPGTGPSIQVTKIRYVEHMKSGPSHDPQIDELFEQTFFIAQDGLTWRIDGYIVCPNVLIPQTQIFDARANEVRTIVPVDGKVYVDQFIRRGSAGSAAHAINGPLRDLLFGPTEKESIRYRGRDAVRVFRKDGWYIIDSTTFHQLAKRREYPDGMTIETQMLEFRPDSAVAPSIFSPDTSGFETVSGRRP